jgi:alpha-ribazole phosphatase/probable phosphoglycerate mutase
VRDGVRAWCLRHGESTNVTGGIAGVVAHAPLTELGHRQAIGAAGALAGEPITRIYCSTALRARQTAGPLAGGRVVEVQDMPELVEVGIGQYEGSTDPVVRRRAADVLRAWVVDGDLSRRLAQGETGHDVLARMTAAFHRIADRHAGETVVVVGHVASLTVALSRLCSFGADVWGTPLPHAVPFLVEWDGRDWSCPAWPGSGRPR